MKTSYKTILIILLSYVASASIDFYFIVRNGQDDATFIIHTFFIAVCVYIWCKQHARENGIENPRYYPLMVFLFAPIGVSAYAFKFYGPKKGFFLILKAFFTFVAATILMLLTHQFWAYVYV